MMHLSFESIARKTALPTPSTGTTFLNKDYVPLTVESLLVFCQTRLRDLDTKIQTGMTKQQDRISLQDAVNEIKSFTAGRTTLGIESDGKWSQNADTLAKAREQVAAGNALFDAAIEKARIADDQPLVDALLKERAKWDCGSDGIVTKEEMEGVNKGLDLINSGLGAENEMQMIGLQSLISKRATALQLTTNMLNTLNESQKTIAGNVGR